MECEFAIHSPLSGRGNQGGCTMNLRAPTVGADGVSTARRRARRNVMEGETVDPSGTLDEDTRLFFEQSPLPQAFTDFDGNFTEVNRTLTQLRSEEHTSELQSLMRISYAVFCLKNKNLEHFTPPTAHN